MAPACGHPAPRSLPRLEPNTPPACPRPCLQVWDDGTLAAPLAGLRDDAGEPSPGGERGGPASDAADPDFSLLAEQAAHAHSDSAGRGSTGARGSGGVPSQQDLQQQQQQHHQHHEGDHEEEVDGYSDDSPRVSL